jgi:hypothetical protein
MKFSIGFCAGIVVLMLAGCGQKQAHFKQHAVQPVEGQVIWKGKPLADATVTFHPNGWKVDPGTAAPRAQTGDDGHFHLTTYETGDGAPEGKYTVTVLYRKHAVQRNGSMFGPNLLPEQYSSPATSGLEVEIAAGTNVVPPLDLGAEPESAANGAQKTSPKTKQP